MFVSASIHGDEIIGVEIIRRIAALKTMKRLRGTLILVPIGNAYGFIGLSRYLPDRRDLNRTFPGNEKGSVASQLAHTFMTEIVSRAQYGLDLHSGAVHRENLPQIRADLDDQGAPTSGDGIPDGSGLDFGADRDDKGAPNSGDGVPDGSGW